MTNATAPETKTFIVRYPVTSYHEVEVERDANITEEALLESVTRDDLMRGDTDDSGAWDSLKSSWRDSDAEVMVEGEDGCRDYAF